MKVKVLSRNPADYIRENKSDIHKLHRNLDPSLHPFEGPREYTRALNAVKLERVFAKPFVSSLDGHTDGVNCIARHPRSLSVLLSGSCDGEVGVYSVLLKLNFNNLLADYCPNLYISHNTPCLHSKLCIDFSFPFD